MCPKTVAAILNVRCRKVVPTLDTSRIVPEVHAVLVSNPLFMFGFDDFIPYDGKGPFVCKFNVAILPVPERMFHAFIELDPDEALRLASSEDSYLRDCLNTPFQSLVDAVNDYVLTGRIDTRFTDAEEPSLAS